MPIHHPVVKPGETPPVGLLAVRDVLVVVIGFDSIDSDSRILVRQPAILASNEPEASRFARQIILSNDELLAGRATAGVARDGLKNKILEERLKCGCRTHSDSPKTRSTTAAMPPSAQTSIATRSLA